MKYFPVCVALVAGLLASAAQAQPAISMPDWNVLQAEQQAGEELFKDHCQACHMPRTGMPFGPSLVGVVGRPAASLPHFPYSEALKKSGLVWTEQNLRKWIADNAHLVPGTLMPHVSLGDPAEQIYVTAYLKTLKSPH